MIKECSNKAIVRLLDPYLTGWSVDRINTLYNLIENKDYTYIEDYAEATHNKKVQTLLTIVGRDLRCLMTTERCGHYNAAYIHRCVNKFRNKMLNYKGERRILFDADNTLYLFSHIGREQEALAGCHNKGYYLNLPIFQEAPDVIRNLQKFGIRVGIATHDPGGYAKEEKIRSFDYYFPMIEKQDIYLIPQGVNKAEAVAGDIEHTILVDDYHGNINDWYEAGGIAIKKSFSGKERPCPVVSSLIDLFYVLDDLNFLKQH